MDSKLTVLYETHLKPQLKALDHDRKKVIKQYWLSLLLGIGFAVIIIPLSFMFDLQAFGIIFSIIIAIVMHRLYSKRWDQYKKDYKHKIITKLINSIDSSFNYKPTQCIDKQDYKNSALFGRHYDRYRGEDFIEGQLDKTYLRFSELHTEYKTQSRNNNGKNQDQWHTIFKGLFFVADANKHFSGQTTIIPNNHSIFSATDQKLSDIFSNNQQQVILDDPEFSQLFNIYSNDQIEARYLLSPSMIQRLINFSNRSDHTIAFSFVDDHLYIAISSSKNYFEPKLFQQADSLTFIAAIYYDLKFVINIVDELDLNTRIWTKP
ncbi:DUF3137 domain-containing protein [Photobacterium carnosum]|uniref:DUF3137 domain-containing protein n=1 Tax=Photobacterium carnosum TaxID=2023717 RepID=UPI001E5751F0|nr:DUF3137 domain-containing protein [Photobacterium carnosum]MCD9514487.1 DUF3137 domain-containing protein [Photobacterium carnosum]